MDILNWLYLRKNQLIRKTVSNPTADLVVLGGDATFAKRDDKYKTYAMTVEDFATAVALPPAYKVFTALLTQSGVSNILNQNSGAVIKGVTYYIDGPGPLADFTNVGAPVNVSGGVYFVAINNEIPNNYDNALLEYNTGAPVVTVLENTIGNIWFTYDSIGVYLIKSSALFSILTYVDGKGFVNGADENIKYSICTSDENTNVITTTNNVTLDDSLLYNTPIEIRVYN